MGMFSFHRTSRPTSAGAALPVVSSSPVKQQRRWSNMVPFVVALMVVAEISLLGKLDLPGKAGLVESWTELFSPASMSGGPLEELGIEIGDGDLGLLSCEEWLEREDAVVYSRDFKREPVLVSGEEKDWNSCSVGCQFGGDSGRKPDASFGMGHQSGTSSVLRSMESAQYYAENNLDNARRKGYNIIMTTSLSSDVPVGYFSWAEYDIMAPVLPKTEKALAAAFISNCGAPNFRLQALEALEKTNITIDSYGGCHRNRDGKVDKVQTLKRYKFSLAFENSNEEDYVTEKFFQSLVAGTIPVVVGPPNIEDFSPWPGSILFIKELTDVEAIAKTMKKLADNPEAYNQSLRWKYEGPSDSFKALVDMAAVHSSCRLCIHLATMIREKEESSIEFKRRPCKCTRDSEVVYHLYVRERGRFEMESIYIRSSSLTLEAFESLVLTKFQSQKHVPIWKEERPEVLRGDDFKLYRIYPVGLTQRQALYTFKFKDDADFRRHVESTLCPKFEVIFV